MNTTTLPVQFSFQGIKIEQFAVFEENYKPKNENGVAVHVEFKLNQAIKQIGIFLSLDFEHGKQKFLKISVSCHFRIENDSWQNFIQQESARIVIPKHFIVHLVMLTVSTTRGVLFAKTEGTFCSQIIVPLLNVNEMITQDATFEIKKDKISIQAVK